MAEKELEEQPPAETTVEPEAKAEAKLETKADLKKAFELSEEEEAKRKKLNKDLKLERVGLLIAAQRDEARNYDPEAFEAKRQKNEPTFDYDEVLGFATEFTGLTPDEYKAAAQAQEAPLADLFKEIGEEEKPVAEVLDKYRKRDEDLTAGIESRPWTLTEQQRNIKLKGRKIAGKGITRVAFREKELTEGDRKETLSTLLKGFEPQERARIYWTGDGRGDAEDAVVKEGQPGYARLEKQAQLLYDPEVAVDKVKAEKIKAFLTDLGPDAGANIRNTLAESEFKKLINFIAVHDANKMAERQGIKWGQKGYGAIKEKALKNAVYEATLLRTVGKFYPPGFISYDLIDPKGRHLSRDNADDDTWFEKAWDNSTQVRLEVIGMDAKGVPVYRLTHPTWHLFEMMDAPQSALTGAMERVARRPKGESVGTAIYEGSLEGLKDRRDFLKAALSSQAAKDGALGGLALGSAGLVAAIVTPDLLMGAAGVARTTKKIADAAAAVADFRRVAPELVDELGTGAVDLARTEDLLQEVQLAVSRGSYDDAIGLIDAAVETAKSSDTAISKVRQLDKRIAQVVDQTDSDISRRIGQRVPEVTYTEGKRLAASVPGSFGETAHNIHPSARRKMLRGKSLDLTVGFGEVLSSRQTLDDLKESIELLKGGDVNQAFTARLREFAVDPFSSDTLSLMSDFDVGMGSQRLANDARQASIDLVVFLEKPSTTRLLRDNPDEWGNQVRALAAKLDFVEAEDAAKFAEKIDTRITKTLAEAKKATAATKRTTLDMARKATTKAIGAVRANFESRAAAMAFVREKTAAQASIDAEPLLVQLTDRYAAIGREGLSPEALQFQDAIIRYFPELEGDDSLKIVKLADQEAKKFAAGNKSRTIADFYQERFVGLMGKADEAAEAPPLKPDVLEPSPKAAEAPPKATEAPVKPDVNTEPLPAGVQRALKGDAVSRAVEAELRLQTPVPAGPIASAPKKKPLPDLQTTEYGRASDNVNLGPQAVFGSSSGGLSERVLYDYLHQAESGVEVAEFLLKHAELDSTRAIMRRILPTLRKNPLRFAVVDDLNDTDGILLEASGGIGRFNGADNTILVRGANWSKTGLSEEVITHELIHAATAKFIVSSPDNASVKALSSLNDEVMETLERRLVGLDGAERQRIENVVSYIKDSPVEFITYALTNPRFQTLLESIEVAPKKTAWNKFTRLLAQMFKFRGKGETNALARALVVSDAVIRDAKKSVDLAVDAKPVVKSSPASPDIIEVSSPTLEKAAQGGGISLRSGTAFNSPVLRVDSVEIPEALRGRGLGVDLYIRALKQAQTQGVGFISDITPNADAMRVYRSLDNLGIKFTRKPVEDASGNLVDAFFIDSKDLAKVDLEAAALQNSQRAVGEQVPLFARMGDEFASDPLVVEFLENGQAIIRAVGTSATVDDFVLALGKISRRDLDAKGMAAVVTWLGARGISVGHRGAVFTGDADQIELAEREFASAFSDYVKSGRADKAELEGPFKSVRERISDIYASLRGAEAEGAALDIDAGLQKSLDKMLRVPAKRVGMPNVLGIVKDALISPNLKGTQVDVLNEIVRESYRLGTPISKVDLESKFQAALKAHNAGNKEAAVIRLPGPVSIRGWTTSDAVAKSEFTLEELTDIQLGLETAKRLELQDAAKLPLGGAQTAITEKSPSQLVDQLVVSSPVKAAARFVYLGGDAYDDMRGLPPNVRDAVMAGARRVQQSIGEAIALVKEGDITNLTKLLTGEEGVTFTQSGRSAVSAGHDSVASVTNMLNQYFTQFDEVKTTLVQRFAIKVRTTGSGAKAIEGFSDEERGLLTESIHEMIKGSRFVEEVFQAAGYTGSRLEPKFMFEPAQGLGAGGLLESLMYYSNVVARKDPATVINKGDEPKMLLLSATQEAAGKERTSQNTFNGLYRDINDKFKDDPMVANRVAILIAGHGMADAARLNWVELGIAADEKLATAMSNYIVGESLNPADVVRVKRAFASFGYDPGMVDGYDLAGVNVFVPRAARARLNMALSQAQDPSLLKVNEMGTMEALNSMASLPERVMTEGGANSKTALSFSLFYRYLKTRMVRGHFVLKSRYFWMNTFDHFNQVAQVAGFRTALVSTMRMSTQNVLSNPLGQAFVFAARQTDRGESTEAVRKWLQSGGDKTAQWAGKLTRASKWNVNVNGILDGTDEIIMIAGKPYKNTQIRQIALEAGIFASFDTSQLGTKIQNVGNLFLTEQSKKGRLSQMGSDILEDLKGASEDIAEAWAERERLGCMVTLMEAGIDPRTAAKISIDALYDYAGSMSKADRNFLLNIFFPFWAFQKNANRQIFDAMFSPEGAYRLGVMRRAYDKGSEYLSYLTYEANVDENGVRTSALPPELRQTYFAFKNALQELYDGNENIPPAMNEQIRMFVADSSIGYAGGQILAADPQIQEKLMDIATSLKGEGGDNLSLDRRALASYFTPRPDKAGMPTFTRTRQGVRIPYFPEDYPEETQNFEAPEDFQRNTKIWNDLYRQTNPSAPYMAFFMPEPTYAAAFNHFSYLMSTKILTLQKLEDMGDSWFTDEDDGSDAVTPLTPLNALLNYERAPVKSDIEASLGVGGATIPKRIAPSLVHFFEYQMIDLLELDKKDDVFDLQIKQEVAVEAGETPTPLPRKLRGTEVQTGKRYYMMPGVAQLLFANSPLGELNDILLRAQQFPAERAAGTRGEVTRWARIITGLDQREIDPSRTGSSEKYRAEETTSRTTRGKVQAREDIK